MRRIEFSMSLADLLVYVSVGLATALLIAAWAVDGCLQVTLLVGSLVPFAFGVGVAFGEKEIEERP